MRERNYNVSCKVDDLQSEKAPSKPGFWPPKSKDLGLVCLLNLLVWIEFLFLLGLLAYVDPPKSIAATSTFQDINCGEPWLCSKSYGRNVYEVFKLFSLIQHVGIGNKKVFLTFLAACIETS